MLIDQVLPDRLRPRDRSASICSRHGSQTLAEVVSFLSGATESVVTSLAGFEISGSAVTSAASGALAGFAGGLRPQLPGGRTGMPSAFKYPAAVSRRIPVVFSMRRSGQPIRPSAITCCRLSSLKTLLTSSELIPRLRLLSERLFPLAGFQVTPEPSTRGCSHRRSPPAA